MRYELPPAAARAIEHVLANTARHFQHSPPSPVVGRQLLKNIDDTLEMLLAGSDNAAERTAILALVGLRRALFMDAPDFGSPPPTPSETVVAA
jgi:hypothetical protein